MSHLQWNDDQRSNNSEDNIQCCFSLFSNNDESLPVLRVESRTVPERDRRAVARRDIAAGEVLVRNAPVAFCLFHANERCGACFATNTSSTTKKLLRCGKCQLISYCSRECQIHDFPFHRMECREAAAVLDDQDWKRDTRLLIRTYIAMVMQQVKGEGERCRFVPARPQNSDDTTNDGFCACSSQHFQQLQPSTTPLDSSERNILALALQVLTRQRTILENMTGVKMETVGGDSLTLQHQLENILRRFRVNNFGMVDDMVRLVGSGVYPLAALLNHSCAPNCLLRYTDGGIVEIVAAQSISKGEEATHSYVELVAPTPTRQERLREIYGFHCQCGRCHSQEGSDKVPLPTDYLEWDANALVDFVLERDYSFDPTTLSRSGSDEMIPVVPVAIDELLHPPSISSSTVSSNGDHVAQQVRMLRHQANLAMANDDLEQELAVLSEAVRLLENKTTNEALSPSMPSCFALDLYQVRCQRLSSWIVAQQPEKALEDCLHIAAVLCIALAQTPNHPLLGLQLFTLGDLYEACGMPERAAAMYLRAHSTLAISQGPKSTMVQLLQSKIYHHGGK